MRPKILTIAAGVLLIAVGLLFFGFRSQELSQTTNPPQDSIVDAPAGIAESTSVQPEPAMLAAGLKKTVAAPVPIASQKPSAQDEESFMVKLRELVETEPERAVAMARQGNARFPTSPNGAERGWAICKALTNLNHFDEAREEAKIMVRMYPDTSFARDVTKHILINPGTHPAERGYGKDLELE